MPVGVWIISECDAVFVFESDESGHRIWAGTVHANHSVVIDRHERECRVKGRVDDSNVQLVFGVDWLPVGARSASKRVYAELEAGGPNCIDVDDVPQVAHVRQDVVLLVCSSRLDGYGARQALHAGVSSS